MSDVILPIVYAGNIQYYKTILENKNEVVFDVFEHYLKQSYRNRTEIHGANGLLSLIIPLVKRNIRTPMNDVRIAYEEDWQKLHWKSFESAYRSSPYFEFYEHSFRPFYYKSKKYQFLVDFNMELMTTILKHLSVDLSIIETEKYLVQDKQEDLRLLIHPKQRTLFQDFNEYTQVFENKNGFIANLSILDLLFNEGPNAINVLITS